MLTPTRTEIAAQLANLDADYLSANDQDFVRSLVRQHPDYTSADYADLDTKLEAVTGFEAQQILAAAQRVEDLDQDMDTVQVQGLLTNKDDNDRQGWVAFIMAVLWDGREVGAQTAAGAIEDTTAGTWCTTCGALCSCGRWCA